MNSNRHANFGMRVNAKGMHARTHVKQAGKSCINQGVVTKMKVVSVCQFRKGKYRECSRNENITIAYKQIVKATCDFTASSDMYLPCTVDEECQMSYA